MKNKIIYKNLIVKERAKLFFIFIVSFLSLYAKPADINITEKGGVGDGKTLNTEIIQKAINECYENGGGRVIIPSGSYLTGSLDLKSNVELHLTNGAVLLGSTNINDYQKRIPGLKSYNDIFLEYALIYAEKQKNISITGNGTIDGQGSSFIVKTKIKPDRYKNRPFVIRFVQCSNVKVKDITMRSSAMWMQQYLVCEDVFINGIRVINHANKNNDMIDIDGCRNVVMSNCIGDTDDDALTLKSTSSFPSENITITNCVLSSHCNAIKLGTESIGGFRNVTISNIVVKPSRDRDPVYGVKNGISGITLASVDGGNLEGIIISNIRIEGTQVPVYLRLGNRGRTVRENDPAPTAANYSDVKISDLVATGVTSPIGCSITGIPGHPVKNISLNNISIEFAGGGTVDDAQKIIPELENHYPESTKWGTLPSYGFFVRHAENISFDDITVSYLKKDFRPAFIFNDISGLLLSNISAKVNEDNTSLIKFYDVKNAAIYNSDSMNSAGIFLTVEGGKSSDIRLIGNDFTGMQNPVVNKSPAKVYKSGNIR